MDLVAFWLGSQESEFCCRLLLNLEEVHPSARRSQSSVFNEDVPLSPFFPSLSS